jgi:hypothetical protein
MAWTLQYIESSRRTTRRSIELGCLTGCTPGPRGRALSGPIRDQPGCRPEDVMIILFIYLYPMLRKALDRAEHCRRDAYLASAGDIGELERRMHMFDMDL